jgi:hypothetical protein
MCCFSRPVAAVAQTNLFARASSENKQFLVYEMQVQAAEPLAMILPLPVPPRSREDALRFIDFRSYRHFFRDLRKPFAPREATRAGGIPNVASLPEATLVVHQVGSFEASFVPTLDDFERLDARFRLSSAVWSQLPCYADWGFAVFKLRDLHDRAAVEPMALEFPRRDPRGLFFPTVHIHDGEVHAEAEFDHNLFFQGPEPAVIAAGSYTRKAGSSPLLARDFASPLLARGVLDENLLVQVARLAGRLPNRDSLLLQPPADPSLEISDGRMDPERAVALVTRLLRARQNDALDDPAAACAAVEYLPWCSQTVGIYGRFDFVPPELLTDQSDVYDYDERSEVYVFGALLHRLIGGRLPFAHDHWGMIALGHLKEPPPHLDSPLDPLIQRAMAKAPEARFPSRAALLEALGAYAG